MQLQAGVVGGQAALLLTQPTGHRVEGGGALAAEHEGALPRLRPASSWMQMAAGLHALVQDADNLDHVAIDGAIVDDVDGPSHRSGAMRLADVSQMQAADAWQELVPIARERTLRIGSHLP